MVNVQTCHKCGSHDVDHATIGLPDAMQCLDCGHIFPQVLSLFPVLKKTEESWPFPTALRPQKHGLPKYNPNNEPDAPL